MDDARLFVTEFDCLRLNRLIHQHLIKHDDPRLHRLHEELREAEIVSPEAIDPDVITMNSVVVLRDCDSGAEERVRLIFPSQPHEDEKGVSILSPLGAALLGNRKGAVLMVDSPADRSYQIKDIVYQPEAAGNFDL
jgi:regulator of nucleoside diphosphate kinase